MFNKIAIVGAGGWGIALSTVLKRAGKKVIVWGRSAENISLLNKLHEHRSLLPGVKLDPGIIFTNHLSDLKAADLILMAIPAQQMRSVSETIFPYLKPGIVILNCAKGIEQSTNFLMTEVIAEAMPGMIRGVLSGPNFAIEVAKGLPAAISVGVDSTSLLKQENGETLTFEISRTLASLTLRPYITQDVIGIQLAGAMKNVLAIASGIIQGKGLGANARAALITRGLAEMVRLGLVKGALLETYLGLSGVGDLVLTCTSEQSRNLRLGISLGQGNSLQNILKNNSSLIEGIWSASALVDIAAVHQVELPLVTMIDRILKNQIEIETALEQLMERPLRKENEYSN